MRMVKICFIVMLLYIINSESSPVSDSFVWETFNQTLSASGYESQLVTGGDGVPTAIWLECTDNTCSTKSMIASRYETDRWSSPTMLASGDYITLPRLTPSINGELLAVWLEQGLTIKSSWWRDDAWTPAATVAKNASVNHIEAVVDSEGIATVIWSSGEIKVSRYQGEYWSQSQTLCRVETTESGYSWCGEPQLAVDGDNVVTAAWVASRSQSPDSLNAPRSSRFKDGRWGEPQNITEESTTQHRLLRIASHIAGDVTAFWIFGDEAQSSQYYDSVWHPSIYLGPSKPSGFIQSGSAKLVNIGNDTIMSVWGGGTFCYHTCMSGPYLTATMIDGVWSTPIQPPMQVEDLATDGLGNAMLLGTDSTQTFKDQAWNQPVKISGMTTYSSPVNLAMSSVGPPIMLLRSHLGLISKRGIESPMTVSIQKNGTGTVVSEPQGIDCGSVCSGYFRPGTEMRLSAVAPPESGYTFSSWEGDCVGAGVCNLTVNSNKTVTAKFTRLPKYKVTVAKPTGGHVLGLPMNSGSPDITDIYCPPDCTNKYYQGQAVVFEARPKDAYYLKGWRGCIVQSDNTCKIIMDRPNMSVKAIFSKKPKYKLTIRKNTHGSVETSLPEDNCAAYKSKCVFKVTEGSEVLLIMKPKPGKTYLGWSGDCVGSQPECRLVMDKDKFAEAIFE